MAIDIRVMSWNIQKEQGSADYIAKIMQAKSIDICALLEVPNSQSATIPTQIIASLNNLAQAYHQNQWRSRSVNVGDEAVSFIWHQTNNVGNNAFKVETYTNAPVGNIPPEIAGKVVRNTNNGKIYFPKTQTTWSSLPGKPNGRRPAFISFVTNDGQGARRFTVLDIHTPFNTSTSIQSYTAYVYASSREINSVETIDPYAAAASVATALPGALAQAVDPLVNKIGDLNKYSNGNTLAARIRAEAVTEALKTIKEQIDTNAADQAYLFAIALDQAVYAAAGEIGNPPVPITTQNATNLARAIAMAASLTAVSMVGKAQLPTAPQGATTSLQNALTAAGTAILNEAGQYSSTSNDPGWTRLNITYEALRMARAAMSGFVFAALPLQNVNASIVAGDFNVHYPDTTYYSQSQRNKLTSANAYSALINNVGAARIADSTTRIGPTAYKGQRLYRLRIPCQIQNTDNTKNTYVGLNVSSLVTTATTFMGNDAWVNGLRALPQTQTWSQITSSPYSDRVYAAFDSETAINDTRFYRANCYDNIFVRGATFVSSGVIDVISELGSWGTQQVVNPSPALQPNPVPAAGGTLNALARAKLQTTNRQFSYNNNNCVFDLSSTVSNAEDAAVFLDQYISDHLPVYVRVQI